MTESELVDKTGTLLNYSSVSIDASIILRRLQIPEEATDASGAPSHSQLQLAINDHLDTEIFVGDGSVTMPHGSASVGIWAIEGLHWKRKPKLHWYVRSQVCTFAFDRVTEELFWDGIARSCFGRVELGSRETISVELDINAFRSEWKNKYRDLIADGKLDYLKHFWQLCSDAMDLLSPADLAEFMKKPGQFVTRTITPDSKLNRDARSYVEQYALATDIEQRGFGKKDIDAARAFRAQELAMVDWEKPLLLTFYNLGIVHLKLPTLKPNQYIVFSG